MILVGDSGHTCRYPALFGDPVLVDGGVVSANDIFEVAVLAWSVDNAS